EQRLTLEQLTSTWQAELEQAQARQVAAHLSEALPLLLKQLAEQFTKEQSIKSRSFFEQAKAEWNDLLQQKLDKDMTVLRETQKRDSEVQQSQNEQSLKSAQSKLEEALKSDYAGLVRHWEKQHTEGLQSSKALWQEQQQKLLAELSGETRTAVKALEHESATLSNKWDRKFSEALEQHQALWPKEQDRLINDMSTSILESLQSQMTMYEESVSQARSKALREMSIKLSEQVALEITQRIDTLRSEFHKDFDQYARGWQGELDAQFTQLSNKYTKQHQQELELLGQESRGDLVKEANITREQLKLTYASELHDAAKELKATFAASLEQHKQTLLHEHHKQLCSLEGQWKISTEAAIGDLLKTTATLHEQQLDKLKSALEKDYRRELQAAALVDGQEREKDHQALAEKAAVSLKEHLSAALKDLESLHAKRLSEIRADLIAQNTNELGRSLKSWQETAKQNIAEQVTDLINTFEARASKSTESIEEKCYLEYRGRLGKMVDELVRRQQDGQQENAVSSQQVSVSKAARPAPRPKEQTRPRRTNR
ncbi:MAG: hypothetical protein Q8S19_08415, partial [Bacillota bacterium]|nr:hypothetical protein [Bacillota bacterium]